MIGTSVMKELIYSIHQFRPFLIALARLIVPGDIEKFWLILQLWQRYSWWPFSWRFRVHFPMSLGLATTAKNNLKNHNHFLLLMIINKFSHSNFMLMSISCRYSINFESNSNLTILHLLYMIPLIFDFGLKLVRLAKPNKCRKLSYRKV